jgi:hypothetical protein
MLIRIAAVLLFAASLAPAARAQPPEGEGPRVIEIETIVVHGRRQAPAAFYVLHRANLGYAVTDLRESFIRRIVQSVRRAPL